MKTLKNLSYYLSRHLLYLAFGMVGLTITAFAQAQQPITVTGKVVDAVGNPIPGTTVMVVGTSVGTITSPEGNFTLECAPTDSLAFSFIGFGTVISAIQPGQVLNITLTEDIAALNEVVVVGYGTMRKSDLTGSITSLSADDLNKGVITTTEQVLQGKVAGLTVIKGSGDPTEGATMRLRGGTSLSASSTPLIVIDGIPGADINSVQASDIESVDVLKDASAAAIYGSRGANGVIIITTTRPQKGKKVEYSNYFSFGKQANYLDLLTADAWRQQVEERKATKAVDFGGDTDWQKEITQNSFSQSHTIAFSNSNEGGGYRASVSYLDNDGIIKTSNLKRLGASISGYTYGFNNKLKLDVGMHSTFDEYKPVDAVYGNAYMINPTAPVYDTTGGYFQTGDNEAINPVEILNNATHDNSRKRILGYAKAELEIIKDLKAVANASYQYNTNQERLYYPTYSKYGEADNGYARRALNDNTTLQLETYLSYNKEIGLHRLNVMGGYSYLDNTYEGFSSQRRDYGTDLFLYNNLGAGLDVRSDDVNSYKGNSKLISFFGRVNYSFNGKYIFTGTLRNDGSSKFGENNKWGLFPSLALGWKISDEAFMDFTSVWLDNMKIRAGYGVTGSQEAIDPYNSLALLGTGGGKYYDPASGSWMSSYKPIQNQNADLKWETTTQTNFGVDVSIFNKLSATLDLYSKLTSDLIFTYAVPQPPNLFNETLANVGDLSNKGVELSLNWNILQTSDLRWDLNLSMAKNISKIEKLSSDIYETDAVPSGSLHNIRGNSNQYSQTIREGYAVGTFWGQVCSGIDENGKFLNVNGDPLKVDAKNDSLNTDLGNPQPKFSLGLSTGATYKNFDFSVTTYGLFGQKVLNATAMALNDASRFPQYNVQPRMFDEGIESSATYSSYWIEDASFFRLQALTLGYTFKFNDIGIEKLRLYAMGENLFVITKYSGLDPEIRIEESVDGKMNGLKSPGIDWFNVYPRPRTFTIGLSCNF